MLQCLGLRQIRCLIHHCVLLLRRVMRSDRVMLRIVYCVNLLLLLDGLNLLELIQLHLHSLACLILVLGGLGLHLFLEILVAGECFLAMTVALNRSAS